jgi:glycosyltransferase involved in cell wall biosynthesis
VYIRGLALRLAALGHPSAIAAPGAQTAEYEHDGLQVYRFASDARPRIELAYGAPDEIAAAGFAAILERVRPRIVHLHARTAAVSERLMDLAHAAGATVVFTYHTPTVSCVRGAMMLFGETPCDGVVEVRRCTACALAGLGVPRPVAWLAATLPGPLKQGLPGASPRLRIPGLMADAQRRSLSFLAKADYVVAVSQWVREVLARNDVPAEKITLSRQGVDLQPPPPAPAPRDAGAGLRIAYFGRIDPTKGPDLLAQAIAQVKNPDVRIDIFGIDQTAGAGPTYACLARQAARDARLRLRPSVEPAAVLSLMAGYDLIAIPSRWLETGPLVALEAFAAGTPVLGARLGGIAELVGDGVDGVLVAPDDPAAWATAIEQLAADPARIEALRAGITAPRTMDAAAADMAALYDRILGMADA